VVGMGGRGGGKIEEMGRMWHFGIWVREEGGGQSMFRECMGSKRPLLLDERNWTTAHGQMPPIGSGRTTMSNKYSLKLCHHLVSFATRHECFIKCSNLNKFRI
jgi:hypothetical protein